MGLDVDAGAIALCFFNDTTSTEAYTLSLHDALPISIATFSAIPAPAFNGSTGFFLNGSTLEARDITSGTLKWSLDRKSTRLNSSHGYISYAVFCLKKKLLQGVLPISCHAW